MNSLYAEALRAGSVSLITENVPLGTYSSPKYPEANQMAIPCKMLCVLLDLAPPLNALILFWLCHRLWNTRVCLNRIVLILYYNFCVIFWY